MHALPLAGSDRPLVKRLKGSTQKSGRDINDGNHILIRHTRGGNHTQHTNAAAI
ncbi:MAG: hypothetical protein Ct9H300mP14_13540 [Gammaproteobacteria bacterium]|nr:MAG: hypothetical protein Ct9H300mP14_13540 [Gammaproteobacteria bacterium]